MSHLSSGAGRAHDIGSHVDTDVLTNAFVSALVPDVRTNVVPNVPVVSSLSLSLPALVPLRAQPSCLRLLGVCDVEYVEYVEYVFLDLHAVRVWIFYQQTHHDDLGISVDRCVCGIHDPVEFEGTISVSDEIKIK